MSEAQLSQIREQLLAMPSEEVDAPAIPMPVVLQEPNDLHLLTGDAKIWNRMLAVGVAPGARDELGLAIGAARAAQSLWTVARDQRKSEAQRAREERAQKLRLDLVAAGR